MSILHEAHHFIISGGQFTTQTTYNQSGIDILFEASTPEASVDAEERDYAPSCYIGTREQYIQEIIYWATASKEEGAIPPLYWMKGPAAVGKSAVAQTCAERLKGSGHLVTAFFFSVNGRRKDHTRFFPTLAYQLSTVLPDYREIVNRKLSVDRTLVKKTMSSQFRSLIVEPLQELREQGKDVQPRAIIIDGLDERQSTKAQMEIIEIIASSIRTGSTPFRWAVFSREEPHIVSTFALSVVSSICHSVLLPISRKADGEIELYLRGGFENILRGRNLFHLSPSWPTVEQIQILVNAAAGLFAHPATVLRFVDRHSYSGFGETLEVVIASISKPGSPSVSAYAELDALYTLILQRVPHGILFSMQLLLLQLLFYDYDGANLTLLCNTLGISERVFQGIHCHLQAVVDFQEYPPPMFDEGIDLERSFFGQELSSTSKFSLKRTLARVHGAITFRHKSFHDFLRDPVRSSSFCVTTPAIRQNLFDCLIQQHPSPRIELCDPKPEYASPDCTELHAQRFISELALSPGMASSSASLSWPHGSEFVDSWIKARTFLGVSYLLSHDHPSFRTFLGGFSSSSLRKFEELDYRKCLLGSIMRFGIGISPDTTVIGLDRAGLSIINGGSEFTQLKDYTHFEPDTFLAMVEKLARTRVIRPYHPRSGSSRIVSTFHAVFRQRPSSKKSGLYKFGHGDKSVIWYWEFDTEKRGKVYNVGKFVGKKMQLMWRISMSMSMEMDMETVEKQGQEKSRNGERGGTIRNGSGCVNYFVAVPIIA
ncbi:hypothetical protein D9756_006433 [Leucocoprinus leucothites]|uniref:Nephrocystin 3-like N-terminal domain-containing protein n=1 Tax=Leucocoprinus leucothites TaxID=201217 RepID=A0A8H5LH17_9AGAR|nr:hypothetical protein D9756_006433 [Leucoagaricus leucothites]